MKIAAWVIWVSCIIAPIIMFAVNCSIGPDETPLNAGAIIRILVIDFLVMVWAGNTIRRERKKQQDKEDKQLTEYLKSTGTEVIDLDKIDNPVK